MLSCASHWTCLLNKRVIWNCFLAVCPQVFNTSYTAELYEWIVSRYRRTMFMGLSSEQHNKLISTVLTLLFLFDSSQLWMNMICIFATTVAIMLSVLWCHSCTLLSYISLNVAELAPFKLIFHVSTITTLYGQQSLDTEDNIVMLSSRSVSVFCPKQKLEPRKRAAARNAMLHQNKRNDSEQGLHTEMD